MSRARKKDPTLTRSYAKPKPRTLKLRRIAGDVLIKAHDDSTVGPVHRTLEVTGVPPGTPTVDVVSLIRDTAVRLSDSDIATWSMRYEDLVAARRSGRPYQSLALRQAPATGERQP